MAPSAIHDDYVVPQDTDTAHSGRKMEAISDAVDAVNVLAACTTEKSQDSFRDYENATASVKAFYAEQHQQQTVAYNLKARNDFKFKKSQRPQMSIWDAAQKLNSLIDESDPDTELSQIEHLLQASEAMRAAGKPRWMILTGFIHDLGKLLNFYGAEGQWDVDTFPVGCAFDKRIILSETFAANPDSTHPIYSTKHGIYTPGCGLDNIMLSWGHDEYLYLVVKDQSTLPDEALAMIRYHSFYPWHSRGAYREFMDEKDKRMLAAVREFNPFDLYSKGHKKPDIEKLKVCCLSFCHDEAMRLMQTALLSRAH